MRVDKLKVRCDCGKEVKAGTMGAHLKAHIQASLTKKDKTTAESPPAKTKGRSR